MPGSIAPGARVAGSPSGQGKLFLTNKMRTEWPRHRLDTRANAAAGSLRIGQRRVAFSVSGLERFGDQGFHRRAPSRNQDNAILVSVSLLTSSFRLALEAAAPQIAAAGSGPCSCSEFANCDQWAVPCTGPVTQSLPVQLPAMALTSFIRITS